MVGKDKLKKFNTEGGIERCLTFSYERGRFPFILLCLSSWAEELISKVKELKSNQPQLVHLGAGNSRFQKLS